MGRTEDNERPQVSVRGKMGRSGEGRFVAIFDRPNVGDRYGNLEVLEIVEGPKGGIRSVRTRCACGREQETDLNNMRSGKSTNCAKCGRKAAATYVKKYFKYADVVPDDEHRRRLLNRLSSAIGRCHNPGARMYPNYGGRGIHVCDEWRSDRRAFLLHVTTLEGWDDPSLDMDRIDTYRGYAPGNIRFVSRSDNNKNKRSVNALEKQLRDVRHRLRRAEESLRRAYALGFCDSP